MASLAPSRSRGPAIAATVRLNPAAIQTLLKSPEGPVLRYVYDVVAQQIVLRSKGLVARSEGGSGLHIQDTIVKRFVTNPVGGGSVVAVIAQHPRAMMYFTGTRPHPINPKKPGGRLVFEWKGQTVYLRHVNHPGTKGNPFLALAARSIGLQVKVLVPVRTA